MATANLANVKATPGTVANAMTEAARKVRGVDIAYAAIAADESFVWTVYVLLDNGQVFTLAVSEDE